MDSLYYRQISLTFINAETGVTTEVSGDLNLSVRVSKSADSKAPDSAQITIFNLAAASRSFITSASGVEIRAGYSGAVADLFAGNIQVVLNTKRATEWETTVIAGDAATAMRQAIINKTYNQPIEARELLRDIAASATPPLASRVEFIDAESGDTPLRGSVRHGVAVDEVERICAPRGWKWSLQDGVLVVAGGGKSRKTLQYLISADTGMIGTPEIINTGQDLSGKTPVSGMRIKAISACIPGIKPHDEARIISRALSGKFGNELYEGTPEQPFDRVFSVQVVNHILNSRDGAFETTIEGVPVESS